MASVGCGIVLVLHIVFITQNVESTAKNAIAMNATIIPFRSFVQSNSTIHNITSRTDIEIDNKVNESATWKNEEKCGSVTLYPPRKHVRIIGGYDAEKGKWPWIAMIMRYYDRNGFSQTCGGTLINPQWVLTAGHCFFSDPTSYTHVVLGAYYQSLQETSVRRFAIAKYICHHLYLGPSNAYEDDACLIKLAGPAEYSDYIKPVCLPEGGQVAGVNETCKIAGWGVTTPEPFGSTKLQTAKVPVVDKHICQSWYNEARVTLPQYHFCAGYEKGGVDSCQGDSGGPLVCDRVVFGSNKVVQFGITSFGIGCALAKRPGVYTNVARYTKWIATKIQENSGPESCFKEIDLLSDNSVITKSGTTFRSPIENTRTWLYPANSRYTWRIQAPFGYAVQLQFLCFFHVEINTKNTETCYDYIRITSNIGFNSVHCGTTQPKPINILGDDITIYFYSDGSIQSSGFVIRVLFTPPLIQIKPNISTLFQPNISTIISIKEHKQSNESVQSPVGNKKCHTGNCGSAYSTMTQTTLYGSCITIMVTLYMMFFER